MATTRCRCGSGREAHELTDAAGLFCARVCDGCEDAVRGKYNPAIFEAGTVYAATGEEEDVGFDPRDP